MAEYLSTTEIRQYELSNGTTVDLVALIDTDVPAEWRKPVLEELAVGQVAYVPAMGSWRRGVITKLGRTKAHITFTTQGAVDHFNRYGVYGDNTGIRVQTTASIAESIRVAPFIAPATGDNVDQEMETPDETAEREAAEDVWDDEELENSRDAFGDLEQAEAELEEGTVDMAEYAKLVAEVNEGLTAPEAPAAGLDPVTGSEIVAVLEETWEAIRANHAELPHVVIVTGSGFIGSPRWAHWREAGWTAPAAAEGQEEHTHNRHGEMFVAGEALARGAKHVIESMLHEGAHTLATVRQIQDTSRQGRWHNSEFRKLAQELGLAFKGEKADPTHGFSDMLLTEATEKEYAELIAKLDKAIRAVIKMPAFVAGASEGHAGGEFIHGGKRPKTGTASSTNNLKLTCKCVDEDGNDKPRIIRASKAVAEVGQMLCTVCDEYFEDRS